MGDWPPEWTLAFRTLDIDVDPLPIAGAGGKGVDAILIDRHPAGRPELAADELRRACHGILLHRHGRPPMATRADPCVGSCRRLTSAMHRGNGPPSAPCRPQADSGSAQSHPLRRASRPAPWR